MSRPAPKPRPVSMSSPVPMMSPDTEDVAHTDAAPDAGKSGDDHSPAHADAVAHADAAPDAEDVAGADDIAHAAANLVIIRITNSPHMAGCLWFSSQGSDELNIQLSKFRRVLFRRNLANMTTDCVNVLTTGAQHPVKFRPYSNRDIATG